MGGGGELGEFENFYLATYQILISFDKYTGTLQSNNFQLPGIVFLNGLLKIFITSDLTFKDR